MIDHVAIVVSDLDRSKPFYVEALGPLGYELVMEFDGKAAGFAAQGEPDFWLYRGGTSGGAHVRSARRTARSSTRSMAPRSRPAERTTASRGYGRTTTRTTTARTSTIRTKTTSRRSATYLGRSS